jgi:undecaprenyl-diphosphatase
VAATFADLGTQLGKAAKAGQNAATALKGLDPGRSREGVPELAVVQAARGCALIIGLHEARTLADDFSDDQGASDVSADDEAASAASTLDGRDAGPGPVGERPHDDPKDSSTSVSDRVVTRVRALPRRTFGPASEEPYRRRTSDWVRVVLAIAAIAVLVAYHDNPSAADQDLFRFFNGLPDELQPFFEALYWAGTLWTVLILAAASLIARRWRLARDLFLAGLVAGAVAGVMANVIDAQPLSDVFDEVTRLGNAPSFPLVRLAIVTAVVSAASPYVTRPTRWLGRFLVLVLGLSAMYLGTSYPSGILAALFLGWGVAALVHLVFGSPGGRPTAAQVAESLAELGVVASDVHLDPVQPTGASLFLANADGGSLWVRVLGRDEADSQFLAKLWRFLVYKDSGPQLYLTRAEDVEHQAYTMLLAERAEVCVPEVVVAGTAGPGAALIVTRALGGRPLAELAADDVSDELLADLWREVHALHDALVAHGELNTRNVLVLDGRPVIVGFLSSTTGADELRRSADVAELLTSTAVLVGDDRAVAALEAGIGTDALHDVIPMLQQPALTRTTQRMLGGHREAGKRLDALRSATAQAAGVDLPELVELHRVSPTNLMMAIGTLIAAAVLLGQVGSPQEIWDTVQGADWWLVGLALVLSLFTNVPYAIALMGCVPIRLPLWPTTETQVAMSFGNLAIPAIGGIAIQIRFLQKRGLDLTSAVAAGGLLSTVANVACQILLFAIAVVLAPTTIEIGPIDTASAIEVVLLAIVVILVAVAVIWGVPRLRRAIVPPVEHAASTVWAALRDPRRLALLVIGNFGVSIVYGFVLLACIAAYGGSVNYWSMLAANIGISTIASLVPVPGGNTAVASIGMSGALVALGVPEAVAVSAILTQQLVVSYIPAFPGWLASKDLLKRNVI